MGQDACSSRAVVLSDTHFGIVKDPTEAGWTNTDGLNDLLNLIESKIKPKTIILLGDIFDLWRVEFEKAWENASEIDFFNRLTKYIDSHEGAELIYVIGNHDHFLKEIRYSMDSKARYNRIIEKKDPIRDEDRCEAKGKSYKLTTEIKDVLAFKNVQFYYPHYRKQFDGLGTVYFDHGHFNTKEERKIVYYLAKIYKFLAKWVFKLNGLEELFSMKEKTSERVYFDLEGNLSSAFSLIYYSKLDDGVRAARDLIWRTGKLLPLSDRIKSGLIILVFALIALVFFYSLLYPTPTHVGILGVLLMIFAFSLGLQITGTLIPGASNMRGKTVSMILPEIVRNDISIGKKDYTYLNLMQDEGNCGDKIDNYIFGHTHVAGKITDEANNLAIYNCGSWVAEEHGSYCTSSFIIIDPDSSDGEKIKVYHMEENDCEECSFDYRGNCKKIEMCKKMVIDSL
jgi:UDP-2,3-diacylglucosamine pyrophosphatase LpxH